MADGILIAKLSPREGLTDDHSLGPSRQIRGGQQPTAMQWDTHRFEVAWSDGVAKRASIFARLDARRRLERVSVSVDIVAERELTRECGRGDARHLTHGVERLQIEEPASGVGTVRQPRFNYLHR